MMKTIKKIGIFDSGIGGLSILLYLEKRFKKLEMVFVADYKNNPFGLKSEKEMKLIVEENIKRLEDLNVDLIVIACNTASTYSYHINSNIEILRITDFVIKEFNDNYNNEEVVIFGTDRTVKSNYYQNILNKDNVKHKIFKSSSLVPLIENEVIDNELMIEELKKIVGNTTINPNSIIILGCTHFNHIKENKQETTIITTSSNNNLKEILKRLNYSDYKYEIV